MITKNLNRLHIVNTKTVVLLSMILILISACGPSKKLTQSEGHIVPDKKTLEDARSATIPEPVIKAPVLPKPTIKPKLETYNAIVTDVPVKEFLFALARDAKMNLDIYNDIEGNITINAIDQTLPQILGRIAKQVSIRYQIDNGNLIISADTPYLHTYPVEYVNMSRDGSGQVELSTQISATGSANIGSTGGGSGGVANNSNIRISNISEHHFWRTLYSSISSIINEPVTGSNQNVLISENVIVNRETGFVTVRATSKQHAEIQKYIDNVVSSAQRQVLIEATIVEVTLSNDFQSGIDWQRLASGPDGGNGFPTGSNGASLLQQLTGSNLASAPTFALNYNRVEASGSSVAATVRLLEEFGSVQVLSSPKIMVLNNQAAVLKVVDNRVFFTIDVNVTESQQGGSTRTTSETEIHTVPVGFVMGLIPFISDKDQIILNIRPTISRILRFVNDPNPDLVRVNAENLIPEIQVREMESVLRLNNGQTAVIGGLMQNQINKDTDAVPGLHRIPWVGGAFKYRNDQISKSELVIFLKAVVIRNPSFDGDLNHLKPLISSPTL